MRDWAVWQARAGCYSQVALSSNDLKTLYNSVNTNVLHGSPQRAANHLSESERAFRSDGGSFIHLSEVFWTFRAKRENGPFLPSIQAAPILIPHSSGLSHLSALHCLQATSLSIGQKKLCSAMKAKGNSPSDSDSPSQNLKNGD